MPLDEYHPPVLIDGEDPDGERTRRARRAVYLTMTGVLSVVMALAVTDAAGVTTTYGVHTAHVTASGGGFELDVRYGKVSRPALATPFDITVRRPGGFTEPVTVAVLADYMALWDENGLGPQPTSERTEGNEIVWTFEPPHGDELTISYDARIEPAAQTGKRGTVSLLDNSGAVVTTFSFTTAVRP